MAKGDFTGDGKIDIAVGHISNKTISIYKNTGTGTFALHSSVTMVGSQYLPYDIVAADFDLDGDLDLAAVLVSNLGIFTNNGTGTFSYNIYPSVGSSQMSITAGQFDGDGKPDLAIASPNSAAGQKLIVLINASGSGTIWFGTPTGYASGNFPNDVETADVNNDGKVDLLSVNTSSNSISVLLGNGLGNLAAPTNYPITGWSNPIDMTVEDFNGDGFKDFVVTRNGFSEARLMLNNGSGGFPTATALAVDPAGDPGLGVISGDFNGDNNADIVFRGSSNLFVYPGTGTGTFGTVATFATGVASGVSNIVTADFNSDNRPDLAVVEDGTSSSHLITLMNNGTYAPEPTIAASAVTFTNLASNAVRIQWTSGNGASRLVVVKQGSAVNQPPVDLTAYTANANFTLGQEIGAGSGNRVVYAGSGSFVDVTGLTAGTTYHVAVYEFNGSGSTTNYRTSGAPTNNVTTPAAEPTTSATTMTFTNITPNSVRVQWTSGNGVGRLVVAKQASAVNQSPTDQSVYVANANFPLGQEIIAGGGNRVVYTSNGSFVDITGLTAGTVYHFSVFEYNGSANTTNYRTTSPATGNVTTLALEPTTSATALTFTNITTTSVRAQWTSGNGAARIVVVKQTSAVDQSPADRTAYTANASFPSGQEIVVGSGNRVVYASTGSFVDVTGLTPGATYHFAVYEYNGAALSLNYKTTTPAINSVITSPDVYVVNPANGSTATSITLTVNGAVGATSYTIEMNTNATFTGTAVVKTSSDLSNNFSEMTFGTIYYTRVKTNLTALWGSTKSFTTGTAPAFAYLTSPANGTTTTSTSLSSNVVPTATLYTIEVSTSSTFPVGATTITKSNASRTMNFPELTFSQLYYARVKTNLSATWGPTQTFTTGTVDNFTYVTTPANGGTTSQYNVTANNITGATLYTIELNTSSTFAAGSAIIKQGASRTQAFPTLAYNQLYYSRVKTDLSPNWGPTRTFTTLGPDAFSYIITPVNGALDVPVDVQLVPNTINGTTSYTLTVSQNPDYSAPFFEEPGTGTPFAPTMYGLAYGTLYYVRVKTSLSANWGPTRSFTTVADPGGRRRTSGATNAETDDKAYPNAVTDHLNFYVHSKLDEDAGVTIMDGKGSIVYQSATDAYTTNREQRIDDLQHLSRGIYYVSVSFGHERRTFRIVKAN